MEHRNENINIGVHSSCAQYIRHGPVYKPIWSLFEQLLDDLVDDDTVHRAYGGVALPNPGSIALHDGLGFVHVASYHEVGFKFGKYWDVSWYEKDVSSP